MTRSLLAQRHGNPITRSEWENWLTATPGFSVTDKIWGTNPRTGRPINFGSECAGRWERPDGAKDGYFQFHEGTIVAIDPDDAMAAKLHEIASALGATVTAAEDS